MGLESVGFKCNGCQQNDEDFDRAGEKKG